MPFVEIKMWAGVPAETRKKMVQKVTEGITEAIKCPPEAVQVVVTQIPKEDWSIGGKSCSER